MRVSVVGYVGRSLLLVIITLLSVVILTSHKAMAGGAIMVGNSVVLHGVDRETGRTYPPKPMSESDYITLQRLLPTPSVIKVYQGDTVQFLGVAANVDPFPIPGISQLQMHYKSLNDNSLNPILFFQYLNRNVVSEENVFTAGTGVGVVPGLSNFILQPPAVQITGPGSDKPGRQYCQFVSTNPTFYLGIIPVIPYFEWKLPSLFTIPGTGIEFLRTMSCAEIAYNYNLTPTISISPSSNGVTLGVHNEAQVPGTTQTYTMPTQWQVTQFSVQDSNDPKIQALMTGVETTSSSDPCVFLKNQVGVANVSNCMVPATSAKSKGSNTIFDKNGAISSTINSKYKGTPFPTSLPDPPAGTSVCYMLSVSKYQPYVSSPNWRNSKIVCRDGAPKKPKVQVLGDDIRVGGKIMTSQSLPLINGVRNILGSWAEYASYSVGITKDFATAAGLKGGKPDGTAPLSMNALTFANTYSGDFGQFSSKVSSQGVTSTAGYFKQNAASAHGISVPLDLTAMQSSSVPYLFDNASQPSLVISGGSIAKGKTVIIVATGSVTIQGNITYTSELLYAPRDIPQVVIVAKDISIAPDVDRIDSWLLASRDSGTINTCNLAPAQILTSQICNKKLTVNGPVSTNHLLLNRTAGSEGVTADTLGAPAEVFNNNGSSYLWAYNYARNGSGITTTKQVELPPRY